MKSSIRLQCAAAALSLGVPAFSVTAQRSAPQVATPDHIRLVLSALADDSMEGRGTGTPGSMRAAKFIAEQFKAAGLTPAGDSGYFQHVPMVTRMTDPASTITAGGTTLRAGTDFAVTAGRSNSRSLDGVEVIYGGTRADASALTADQVRGKLVVVSASAAPAGGRRGGGGATGGGGAARPAPASCRDTPVDATAVAAARGGGGGGGGARGGRGGFGGGGPLAEAAGVATIEGDALSPRTRWSATHTGTAFVRDPSTPVTAVEPAAAAVSITTHAAEALLGAPAASLAPGAGGKTIHSSVKFIERPALGGNVVGMIEGADPAMRSQVILVDAHYDHLGIALPPPGSTDSIYNGADDDASGTTAVIEIARALLAGPPPKRTVILMATTGEEVGLVGTNWYIAHPVRPLSQMVANLEIEMMDRPDALSGGSGKGWLTGFERSTLGDTLAAHGLPIVPDPRPEQSFFARSDNIAYARMGIPAHTLSSFDLHADYHQPNDEVGLADFNHMAGVINAGISAVALLANGLTPVWYPNCKP